MDNCIKVVIAHPTLSRFKFKGEQLPSNPACGNAVPSCPLTAAMKTLQAFGVGVGCGVGSHQ
jgi:hypothetical protein